MFFVVVGCFCLWWNVQVFNWPPQLAGLLNRGLKRAGTERAFTQRLITCFLYLIYASYTMLVVVAGLAED